MPNHVKNKVFLDCSEERAKEILEAVQYDLDPENEEGTGVGTIDFNKLIPMPKSMLIECSSRTHRGIEIYLTAVNPDTPDWDLAKMPKEEFEDLLERLNGERLFSKYNPCLTEEEIRDSTDQDSWGKLADLGKQAVTNFTTYGATTWYEWSVNNWGTKWNSYDSEKDEDVSLIFSTAWSAPHPVIEALAKRYPDVTITHEWADEDIGYNCGRRVFVNGECQSAYLPQNRKAAVRFANDVWGYGDDEDFSESDDAVPVQKASGGMSLS